MGISRSMEALLSQRTICLGFLVCLLVLISLNHQAEANSCTTNCMNGGRLRLPNNIFGFCHCQCMDGFGGPKCQFGGKRNAPFGGIDGLDTDLSLGQALASKRLHESWDAPLENTVWGKLLARARLAQAAADIQGDDHE